MKFTTKNTAGKNITIHDSMGRQIHAVKSFDTKTCKITFYPLTDDGDTDNFLLMTYKDGRGGNITKTVTTTWPGAYAKINGERVK